MGLSIWPRGGWLLAGGEATARHTGVPQQLAACRKSPGRNCRRYLTMPCL